MSITIEYLWKDRKRHLGMPLSFTRYQLSEDRLFLSQGFLNIKDDEVLLYRVRDIDTRRSLFQRLFGVGTITVLSSDRTTPTLVLKNVKNPLFVKELIHKQVEEMKLKRREPHNPETASKSPSPGCGTPEPVPGRFAA